ncbi:MAG: 4-hydroxythreonine-4-phosphate dehydrogenase PdxA [Rhodobacteraceae bacterium]|nr:4-hydroxythreonine-4-phosphate dehydrogenase PdxA [Paracoccaceae bacterium]
MRPEPALALTMGDPAGIGGELTFAAWRTLRDRPEAAFFSIDDPVRLEELGAPVARLDQPEQAAATFPDALPVLPEPLPGPPIVPGAPNPAHAAATIRSIERAVVLARSGMARAVVTNPINKKALYDGAGFPYPGHTEFLAALGGVDRTVMMLAGPELRVVPVTIHIALDKVAAALSPELLETTIHITHRALIDDFGLSSPRLAVAGLNPHAGEGGAMGREEITVITPVLKRLRAEGIDLSGPRSADVMFHAKARADYDAAICMYHDQALIPLKTLDFDRGVNVTLGLPFIRTSPDHGTAYDIAGQGRADPTSLIEAILLAAQLAAQRAAAL